MSRWTDVSRTLGLEDAPRYLVGLWLNRGVSGPRKTPSKWMRDGIRPGSFWGDRVRETIASQVSKIRHWQVYHLQYADCPVQGSATWFIDPPYQGVGTHYRFGTCQRQWDTLRD